MQSALIGCECSAIVRDALRSAGVDAWSCDLKPCDGDPQWHIQGDVIEAIKSRHSWDFIGLHPDCTSMTVSGNRHYAKGTPGWQKRQDAVAWTSDLWELAKSRSRRSYLENPRGVLPTIGGMVHYQFIQPHQFGHGECKGTCLWLHRLPPLMHSSLVPGREQRVWKMAPGENRKTNRSRSFPGIATAMAAQWARLILQT